MNSPQLPVLIAEVDQTGNVEQKLDKVMTHKEDQTQAVQAVTHKETSLESFSLQMTGKNPHKDTTNFLLKGSVQTQATPTHTLN